MFKLKTITLEINSNATALDIQKLIKLLQPETMPLKKKKRKKTEETWDKAFSRCGNLALNLLRLSKPFSSSFFNSSFQIFEIEKFSIL